MEKFDKLLGPLAPNLQAQRTASHPKHVLVFGAETQQGQSVCKNLISGGAFVVYGLVDRASSTTISELSALQVQLIQVNFSDVGSYEEHLRDKDSAFLHVDFAEFHTPGEDVDRAIAAEFAHSRTILDACLAAGVKHVVYSALDDFPPDKRVAHCSAKAKVVKYIQSTSLPTTYLYTCTPFSDVLHHLSRQGENDYLLAFPITDDTALPGFPVEQTGEWVKVAMAHPDKWAGQIMHACTEHPTPSDIAATLSGISEKHVDTAHLSRDAFYSPEHQARVGLNWAHYRSYLEGFVERDVQLSERVVPHQWSFKQWAIQNPELKKVFA